MASMEENRQARIYFRETLFLTEIIFTCWLFLSKKQHFKLTFVIIACREKLKQYQEKLAEVEKLLEMDPTNGEILTLKKDLMEVIDLTADLVRACLDFVKTEYPRISRHLRSYVII